MRRIAAPRFMRSCAACLAALAWLAAARAHPGAHDTRTLPLTARAATCSAAMFAATPAQTSGPFYLPAPERADVTERRAGAPLALTVAVRDRACNPVPARVAIWHTDSHGVYSGFVTKPDGGGETVDTRGETFLRGELPTEDDGTATFKTIVPGWYTGRPVHVHFTVFYDDGEKTLTSQLYFREETLREVSKRAEYKERGSPNTTNEDERVPGALILDVKPDGKGGYKSRFEVSIDYESKITTPSKSANSTATPTTSKAVASSTEEEKPAVTTPAVTTPAATTPAATTLQGDTAPPSSTSTVSSGAVSSSAVTSGTSTRAQAESNACFPADALVLLESGRHVRMEDLAVGDRVLVGKDVYGDVFGFSHQSSDVYATFLRFRLASGDTFSVTPGHYLVAADTRDLIVARDVAVGKSLILASGASSAVVSVTVERSRGLYNPQTLGEGTIVVDGVVASTYTEAVKPELAHALLAPVRCFYQMSGGMNLLGGLLSEGGSMYGVKPGFWSGKSCEPFLVGSQ